MELICLMMRIAQVVSLTALLFFIVLFCAVECIDAYHRYCKQK